MFDIDDPVEPVDSDAGASVVVVVEPQHRVPQSVAAAFLDLDGHVTDVVPAEDCSFRRKRAIRSTRLPTGIVQHSRAWGQALAKHRWAGRTTPVQDEASRLCDGFNLLPLRAGDMADKAVFGLTPTHAAWTHANTFQAEGLLKVGFGKIGKGARRTKGQVDICGTHRNAEALETVAGIFDKVYVQKSVDFKNSLYLNPASALLLMRHFDSTPLYLKYGPTQSPTQCQAGYGFQGSGPNTQCP